MISTRSTVVAPVPAASVVVQRIEREGDGEQRLRSASDGQRLRRHVGDDRRQLQVGRRVAGDGGALAHPQVGDIQFVHDRLDRQRRDVRDRHDQVAGIVRLVATAAPQPGYRKRSSRNSN